MIGFIVLYFAIGMLLVTKLDWDKLIRLRKEENFTIPMVIAVFIGSCFVVPIACIVGAGQWLIESFRNN